MAISPIVLDGRSLTIEQVVRVARDDAPIVLNSSALEIVAKGAEVVRAAVEAGRPLYGVNVRVAGVAAGVLPPAKVAMFQRNIILSNAAGVGPAMPREVVRAMMLLRANTLALGLSGVSPHTLEALVALLNSGIIPLVPCQGSVGASGDLAPLAHMALVLLGRGEANVDGERLPGDVALRRKGLHPVKLAGKDGSALINGAQAITAYGALAVADAAVAVHTADVTGTLTLEALRGFAEAFDTRLHAAHPHPGQVASAAVVRHLIIGSHRLRTPSAERVHDAYSLRCMPQVHGAAREAVAAAQRTIALELNAASDNPLVFPTGEVLSGGNFHGEVLGHVLDLLAIALVGVMGIIERRIARLTDSHLSGLPPFLAQEDGISSGWMLAQVTAASLVSESKVLASPSSVDSIPTSANAEDYVSMATFAARKLRMVLEHTWNVLAIEALCAAHALDLDPEPRPGDGTAAAVRRLRRVAPFAPYDRELSADIETVADALRAGAFAEGLAEVQHA